MAASSHSAPVIRACANKKNGALRLASKCKKSERAVSWSQQGPAGLQGPTGASGAQGLAGLRGETGSQGPGAKAFSAESQPGSAEFKLAQLPNGLHVEGLCFSSTNVEVIVETDDGSNTFEGSGLVIKEGSKIFPVDVTGGTTSGAGANSPAQSDFDLLVRNGPATELVHVMAHGTFSPSGCKFWGMVIPPS